MVTYGLINGLHAEILYQRLSGAPPMTVRLKQILDNEFIIPFILHLLISLLMFMQIQVRLEGKTDQVCVQV